MVKAVFTGNKEINSKNFNVPKDGFIQKKRNNKFKQTPAGKIALINGSKARNNKNMKQQNLQKQTSNSPQKPFEKSKDQRKKDYPSNDKQKEFTLQKELNKKKITLVDEQDDSDSEIDEDINEGVVLEDQSMVDESDNCEDEDESDDESEEEKNVLNILGNSLADESDEDDDDYKEEEAEEEKGKNVQSNKGIKMFKGLKQADSSSDSVKNSLDNSTLEETLTDDNDEENDDELEEEEEEEEDGEDNNDETDDDDDDEELEEEDCSNNENEGEDEDEDEDEEDEDEDEDEDEADESALGLKALLDNTIADDDEDDEDFVESGENDEDDDISDEEDEEEEEDGNSTLDNSQPNSNTQDKADTSLENIKTDKRTIFVGNLPVDVKRAELKKLFKKFGTIETIRLRGTISKSLNVPKKVAVIKKDVHPKLKSVCAYILYASEKCAKAALAMNGTVFEGHYLRVDSAEKSENRYDTKKSIFLGNLSFKLDDDTLREHFAECGEIESVRVIRDNRTGIGKGIGFVNFKTEDAVALALELDGTLLLNREVRVKLNTEQNKKKEKHGKRSHSAESEHNVAHKKSKNNESVAVPVRNKQNAIKRINDKEQQFGKKQASPQQGKIFQGQKADASKKKKKNKLEKKKKVLAEKLTAKSKKPSN